MKNLVKKRLSKADIFKNKKDKFFTDGIPFGEIPPDIPLRWMTEIFHR